MGMKMKGSATPSMTYAEEESMMTEARLRVPLGAIMNGSQIIIATSTTLLMLTPGKTHLSSVML
jgi:predicted ATPase